jgi:hypothetical protein
VGFGLGRGGAHRFKDGNCESHSIPNSVVAPALGPRSGVT